MTMQPFFRILMLVFFITGLAVSASSVEAQQFSPPLPRDLTPQWDPIPGAPGVQHAPNTNSDLFRYGQRYYYQHEGKWYQARNTAGPWKKVKDVPRSFRQIEAPYFKQPPGWAKGKKSGWSDASMPPGQMKKYEGSQHMPPGQMKKHGN
jgi:hypothetical protein